MKTRLFLLIMLLAGLGAQGQQTKRVLFVGNSYTATNNLPQMVQQVAQSVGETLEYESNAPGGCTFSQHCQNQTVDLIERGGWDVVVLQEQSQLPSFPQSQVENEVFPYATTLVNAIYQYSPCAEPMFFMTWGYRDGDARNAQYFPVLGTYEGMDSMLCERYLYMASYNDAAVCPVGRVWRYLRTNHRDIELYLTDGSHPSQAGSYAAACAFYTMIFGGDPTLVTYEAGLDATVAATIRNAVHEVVYNTLADWKRNEPGLSVVQRESNGLTANFMCVPIDADSVVWDFGDGTQEATLRGTSPLMSHTYAAAGTYTVTVTALRHCMSATESLEVQVSGTAGIGEWRTESGEWRVWPNPASDHATVSLPEGATRIALLAADGRQVWQADLCAGGTPALQIDLPVEGLPAGIYTLVAETPSGRKITTILLRHRYCR